MNKKFNALILLFLCFFPTTVFVKGTRTIIDTTLTLELLEFEYFSFTVGFAQTAEVTITFECSTGTITLFLLDEENFNRFLDLNLGAKGWSIEDRATGSMVHELKEGKWYILLWTADFTGSTVSITATLDVISNYSLIYIVLGVVFVGVVVVWSYLFIKRRSKPQSSVPPVSLSPPPERYCPDCGKEVPPDLNYCGHCGARLTLTLSAEELDTKA